MPPMYLDSVLQEIKKESAPPKALHAEHLFKLNEAVFNLNEEDTVDKAMAAKLFQAIEQIRIAYNSGKFDNTDSNFFYDYLALLGTMQNQHFFSQKQTEKMLGWIGEVVSDSSRGDAEVKEEKLQSSSSKTLQAEIEKLKKKLAKYEDGNGKEKKAAVTEPEKGKKGGKSSGKSSWDYYDDYYEEPAPAKSKGKGKGKSKVVDDEPPPSKGKGKKGGAPEESGKGKGKAKDEGKGKAKDEGKGKKSGKKSEPEPKGKGTEDKSGKAKAKGKGKDDGGDKPTKSKGKGKDKSESPPPVRASKAKAGKGNGKSEKASRKGKKY